jgi:nitrogen fixation protein FixH
MLYTLFGGGLAIVLVYFALAFTPLPRYWRVVIPAGLAFTGYLVYAMVVWPGLDVLAMHVAVYVVIAVLLSMTGRREGEAPRKFQWIPMLFVAFFAILSVLYAGFIYLASHGLPDSVARHVLPRGGEGETHTAFPGVVPHGEEAAKGIATHLKQQYRQSRLGWQVEVQGLRDLRLHTPGMVTVRVLDRSGAVLANAKVVVALLRPAREMPIKLINAAPGEAGNFVAQVVVDEPGEWIVALRVMQDREVFEIQERLNLAAAQ